MNALKKNWIVVFTINVGSLKTEDIPAYVEGAKYSLTGEDGRALEEFFGTKVLTFFIPEREQPTKIEVFEFVLDGEGQKHYEKILTENNPTTVKMLDTLKELINGCK